MLKQIRARNLSSAYGDHVKSTWPEYSLGCTCAAKGIIMSFKKKLFLINLNINPSSVGLLKLKGLQQELLVIANQ